MIVLQCCFHLVEELCLVDWHQMKQGLHCQKVELVLLKAVVVVDHLHQLIVVVAAGIVHHRMLLEVVVLLSDRLAIIIFIHYNSNTTFCLRHYENNNTKVTVKYYNKPKQNKTLPRFMSNGSALTTKDESRHANKSSDSNRPRKCIV